LRLPRIETPGLHPGYFSLLRGNETFCFVYRLLSYGEPLFQACNVHRSHKMPECCDRLQLPGTLLTIESVGEKL
jgi:hypothetical protein